MTWTKKKQLRLEYLIRAAIPLREDEIVRANALAEMKEKIAKEKDDAAREELEMLRENLLDSLPRNYKERLVFSLSPERLTAAEIERQALQYEQDCQFASEAIKKTLESPAFLSACEKANVAPTRRQASKWNRLRRGAANRAAGRI